MAEAGTEDTKHTATCPDCGSTRLIKDFNRAEIVCLDCGLVIKKDIVDRGPEWRAFDLDQKNNRARTGAPSTFTIHDKGLSTMIDWRDRDIYGKDISSGSRSQIYRLRKWQKRIRVNDAAERNLSFALVELNRLCSNLRLPNTIKEDAAVVYRNALDAGLIRGRSIESVTAAAVYAACRKAGIPRTLNEIEEVSHVSRKEIGRSYRFISFQLQLELAPTNPVSYIPRFASKLGLSPKVQRKAVEILQMAFKAGLTSGKGPMGTSAAALYIASIQEGERRTQKEVAEVAKVTEVTVRNRYKEFEKKLGLQVDV